MDLISVITPCYKAEAHIARAARSVLAQGYKNWEMVVISDDGVDYERALGLAGIADARIRHVSTGKVAGGVSAARNAGFDAARGEIVALLDADDEFAPEKLEICAPAAHAHGVVSTGIGLYKDGGVLLRTVATGGPARLLDAGEYKLVNYSGDSMLTIDRVKVPVRYDEEILDLEDFDFLMRCFEKTERVFHAPAPLYKYYKRPGSLTNSADTSERFFAAKKNIRARMRRGEYALCGPGAIEKILEFIDVWLAAEIEYAGRIRQEPALLFEDVIEPLLTASVEFSHV